MDTLKIQRIGDGLGVALPEDILQKLQVSEGDTLWVRETPEGIELTKDSTYPAAMEAFAETRKNYRNALHELAQ